MWPFRRKAKPAPFDEQQAYARSYGDRSGDILRVEPIPPAPVPPSPWESLTGELLRKAFENRLNTRSKR